MAVDFHFDYEQLYLKLLEVSRQAFHQLHQYHAGESFYLYGLYSCDVYAGIVGYSEEALTRTAQKYLERDRLQPLAKQDYVAVSIEDIRTDLRYYLGSDAYFCPYHSLFEDIDSQLEQRWNKLFEVWQRAYKINDTKTLQWCEDEYAKFDETCYRVLKQLDLEQIFGINEKRNNG